MKTQASNALLHGLLDELKADTSSVINSALGTPVRPENSPLYDRSLTYEERLSAHKALEVARILELKRQSDELKGSDRQKAIELMGQAVEMARELNQLMLKGEPGLRALDDSEDRSTPSDIRGDRSSRWAKAVRAHAGTNDTQLLGRLCRRLANEPDVSMCHAIVHVLGQTTDPQIIDWLKNTALSCGQELLEHWCIMTLVYCHGTVAVPALTQIALNSHNDRLRKQLHGCMSRSKRLEHQSILCQMLLNTPMGSYGLGVPQALDGAQYPETTKWLIEIGLTDPREEVRWAATEALLDTQDPAACRALGILVAEDPSSRVRSNAARALRKAGELPALLHLLRDDCTVSEEDQGTLMNSAASTSDPRVPNVLLEIAMTANKEGTRYVAARNLSKITDRALVQRLIEEGLEAGLKVLIRPHLNNIFDAPGVASRLKALRELGKQAIALCTRIGRVEFSNWSQSRKWSAIHALMRTKDPAGLKALCQLLLKDKSISVRCLAAGALRGTDDPSAMEALRKSSCRDPASDVMWASKAALAGVDAD